MSLRFAIVLAMLAAGRPDPCRAAADPAPRVLVVTAHPDDETTFAASLFKITHALSGAVDLAVVTTGEGGFRYATLAEPLYGLRLTDESVGRARLPGIRKRELLAGGAVLGLRNYYFLDQPDGGYTEDAAAVLRLWNADLVRTRLGEILARGRYDVVFTMLPTAQTHGAHQAATLLTLEAIAGLPEADRPAVLGALDAARGAPVPAFKGQAAYPLTRVRAAQPLLEFDRREPMGHGRRLDYRIVVNWVIAEHKSQGLTQTLMNASDVELFYVFEINDARAAAAAGALFRRLSGVADVHTPRAVGRREVYGVCPIPP